jgi:diguanylate cyclase (GGDEF)-like protein
LYKDGPESADGFIRTQRKDQFVSRALRFYDLLNRLPFAASFKGKIIFAVVVSVLLPVAAMEIYFIGFSELRGEQLERAILISGLASATAAVFSYWALSTILRPILSTAKQLNQFLNTRTLPDLPVHYRDEVGSLMSNVNYITRSMHDLVETANQNGAIDHLTGIYNRRSAENRLKDSIELARIRQNSMSFAILDIDNFKTLNDTYGHDFGDTVLRQIGDLLRTNVRRSDWVGRWGGDEFVISIQGGEREANAMLSRICESARKERFIAPNQSVHTITFSCGVCEWQESMDPQALFTKADEALYSAKRGGRDQVHLWSEMATA